MQSNWSLEAAAPPSSRLGCYSIGVVFCSSKPLAAPPRIHNLRLCTGPASSSVAAAPSAAAAAPGRATSRQASIDARRRTAPLPRALTVDPAVAAAVAEAAAKPAWRPVRQLTLRPGSMVEHEASQWTRSGSLDMHMVSPQTGDTCLAVAAIAVPLALNNDAQRLPVRVRKEIADEWDFDGGKPELPSCATVLLDVSWETQDQTGAKVLLQQSVKARVDAQQSGSHLLVTAVGQSQTLAYGQLCQAAWLLSGLLHNQHLQPAQESQSFSSAALFPWLHSQLLKSLGRHVIRPAWSQNLLQQICDQHFVPPVTALSLPDHERAVLLFIAAAQFCSWLSRHSGSVALPTSFWQMLVPAKPQELIRQLSAWTSHQREDRWWLQGEEHVFGLLRAALEWSVQQDITLVAPSLHMLPAVMAYFSASAAWHLDFSRLAPPRPPSSTPKVAEAYEVLEQLRPIVLFRLNDKQPPQLRTLRNELPDLPLPWLISTKLLVWCRAHLRALVRDSFARLKWVHQLLKEIHSEPQRHALLDSVSSLEKKLTEAESDLRQLCSLHDAHEAGHQEAQLTRLQTLSTPTMQTFLATFGFEISDEDQALMNAAKTNNREKTLSLTDPVLWEGETIFQTNRYRAFSLAGGAVAGYTDSSDIIAQKALYEEYLQEMERLERENARRLARGAELLRPKFRRPPRIDDQPLLDDPDCLLLARNGLLFTEANNHSLRFYSFEKQQVETLVGKRGRGRADGPLADAALNRPRGLAELRDGSLVVVDTGNAVLRLIDAQWRTVTTLKQRFIEPYGVAARYDAKLGQLIYVSDRDQGCIYMLFCPKPADSKAPPLFRPDEIRMRLIAGQPGMKSFMDGGLRESLLQAPGSLFCRDELLYFCDQHSVRMVDTKVDYVRTVVGQGQPGRSYGSRASARLRNPRGLAIDPVGNVYICDDGRINVFTAATSQLVALLSSDMPNLATATPQNPTSLVFEASGCLVVADAGDHKIFRVSTPAAHELAKPELYRSLTRSTQAGLKLFSVIAPTYRNLTSAAAAADQCLQHAAGLALQLRQHNFAASARTFHHLLPLASPAAVQQALGILLATLARLSSLEDVLGPAANDKGGLAPAVASFVAEHLPDLLLHYQWDQASTAADTRTLSRLIQLGLVNLSTLCVLFRNSSFRQHGPAPLTADSNSLLVGILQQYKCQDDSDFCTAVAGWLESHQHIEAARRLAELQEAMKAQRIAEESRKATTRASASSSTSFRKQRAAAVVEAAAGQGADASASASGAAGAAAAFSGVPLSLAAVEAASRRLNEARRAAARSFPTDGLEQILPPINTKWFTLSDILAVGATASSAASNSSGSNNAGAGSAQAGSSFYSSGSTTVSTGTSVHSYTALTVQDHLVARLDHILQWWDQLRTSQTQTEKSDPDYRPVNWLLTAQIESLCRTLPADALLAVLPVLHSVREHASGLSDARARSAAPEPQVYTGPTLLLLVQTLMRQLGVHSSTQWRASAESWQAFETTGKFSELSRAHQIALRLSYYPTVLAVLGSVLPSLTNYQPAIAALLSPSCMKFSAAFLVWWEGELAERNKHNLSSSVPTDLNIMWNIVNEWRETIIASLVQLAGKLVKSTLTPSQLDILQLAWADFASACRIARRETDAAHLHACQEFRNQLQRRLQRALAVSSALLHNEDDHALLLDLQRDWHQTSLKAAAAVLGTNSLGATASAASQATTKSLSLEFAAELDWLDSARKTALFSHWWAESQQNSNAIVEIKARYPQLCNDLVRGQLTVEQVADLSPLLGEADLELLRATLQASLQASGGNPPPLSSILDLWKAMSHFVAVVDQRDQAAAVVKELLPHVAADSQPQCQRILAAITSLQSANVQPHMSMQMVAELRRYSGQVPVTLLSVSTTLAKLAVAPENKHLLDWLRRFNDENAFKASLEVALSKADAEIPAELAHCRDEVLSSLDQLRRVLYFYLYRTPVVSPSLENMLQSLASAREIPDDLPQRVQLLLSLLKPLKDLIDASDPSLQQILGFFVPSRHTLWTVRQNQVLQLTYTVSGQQLSLTEADLEELRASVLLQSDERTPDQLLAVDSFIQSFAWMRSLAHHAMELHEHGHVNFLHFEYVLPLHNCDLLQVQREVQRLKALLEQWQQYYQELCHQRFILSFMSAKTAAQLIAALMEAEGGQDQAHTQIRQPPGLVTGESEAGLPTASPTNVQFELLVLVRQVLSQWNADAAADEGFDAMAITDSVRQAWKQQLGDLGEIKGFSSDRLKVTRLHWVAPAKAIGLQDQQQQQQPSNSFPSIQGTTTSDTTAHPQDGRATAAFQLLAAVCVALEMAFAEVPLRARALPSEAMPPPVLKALESRVHLLPVENLAAASAACIMAFAGHSRMPEARTCLCLSESSTTDHIEQFVRRWALNPVADDNHDPDHDSENGLNRNNDRDNDKAKHDGDSQDETKLAELDGASSAAKLNDQDTEHDLHCLVAVGASIALQSAAVTAILRYQRRAHSPLLVIINAEANQPLLMHLGHAKITLPALSRQDVRRTLMAMLTVCGNTVCVLRSNHAGAGKSFAVRQQCRRQQRQYNYLPVTSATDVFAKTAAFLSSVVYNNADHMVENGNGNVDSRLAQHKGGGPRLSTLHLDLDVPQSQVGELDRALVNIILLNVLGGAVWPSCRCHLLIEVASGSQLETQVSILSLLPHQIFHPAATAFIVDRAALQQGAVPGLEDEARQQEILAQRVGQVLQEADDCDFARLPLVTGLARWQQQWEQQHSRPPSGAAAAAAAAAAATIPAAALGQPSAANHDSPGMSGAHADLTQQQGLMTGARLYQLVQELCYESTSALSYWSVWNFLRVLDVELQALLAADGLLAAVADGMQRSILAADLLNWALLTAKSVALRQDAPVGSLKDSTAMVSGFQAHSQCNGGYGFFGMIDHYPAYKHLQRDYFLFYSRYLGRCIIANVSHARAEPIALSVHMDGQGSWQLWRPRPAAAQVHFDSSVLVISGTNNSRIDGSFAPLETSPPDVKALAWKLWNVTKPESGALPVHCCFWKAVEGHSCIFALEVNRRCSDFQMWQVWRNSKRIMKVAERTNSQMFLWGANLDNPAENTAATVVMPPNAVPAFDASGDGAQRQGRAGVSAAAPPVTGVAPPLTVAAGAAAAGAAGVAASAREGGSGSASGEGLPAASGDRQASGSQQQLSGLAEPKPAETEASQQPEQISIVNWADSSHDMLLFAAGQPRAYLCSAQPYSLSHFRMTPLVAKRLRQNNIHMPDSIKELGEQMYSILSSVTGVVHTEEDAQNLLGGKYVMTPDNFLKLLALYLRIQAGLPVALMGECGCGKTMLLRWLCAWLKTELVVLDVHGGTTEEDIEAHVARAEQLLATAQQSVSQDGDGPERSPPTANDSAAGAGAGAGAGAATADSQKLDSSSHQGQPVAQRPCSGPRKPPRVFLFLDEVNACPHLGLVREILFRRTLRGRPLPAGLTILVALNPRRKRAQRPETQAMAPGLVFSGRQQVDELAALVYRVHPIRSSFLEVMFDFGALTDFTQADYIKRMVADTVGDAGPAELQLISSLIQHAQNYIRQVEGDSSAASLRDVRRCLNLYHFFTNAVRPRKTASPRLNQGGAASAAAEGAGSQAASSSNGSSSSSGGKARLSPRAVCITLGLAFTYLFRLPTSELRESFWNHLRSFAEFRSMALLEAQMDRLGARGTFENIVAHTQQSFCQSVELTDDDVAMNDALAENFFVCVIGLLNKIPVLLVGSPGSSKSLTLQIIQSNLQGPDSSVSTLFKRFPSITFFNYQCSPLSTAGGILNQFRRAVRFQEQTSRNSLAVLVLDEIGLAEFSPDLPLKVLHSMLVDPPVPILGLSNWTLDSAKMNRCLCINRPIPTITSLVDTGASILGLDAADATDSQGTMRRLLQPLAAAFSELQAEALAATVDSSKPRTAFVGMRDFYALLKMLRRLCYQDRGLGVGISSSKLTLGVARNFGGNYAQLQRALHAFHQACGFPAEIVPPVVELVQHNLKDTLARHLLLFTTNSYALEVLFGSGLVDESRCDVIVGSTFREDVSELRLVQQINAVRLAMAAGRTVILVNAWNIFESLYDVLNMKYVMKPDSSGRQQKLLRLAIGGHSQLCPVADGFKAIVVVEEEAQARLDLPFVNRFERQLLRPRDVLTKSTLPACQELQRWALAIVKETGLPATAVFPHAQNETIPSALLRELAYAAAPEPPIVAAALERAKKALARLASSVAVAYSPLLQTALGGLEAYRRQECLSSLMLTLFQPREQEEKVDAGEGKPDTAQEKLRVHSPAKSTGQSDGRDQTAVPGARLAVHESDDGDAAASSALVAATTLNATTADGSDATAAATAQAGAGSASAQAGALQTGLDQVDAVPEAQKVSGATPDDTDARRITDKAAALEKDDGSASKTSEWDQDLITVLTPCAISELAVTAVCEQLLHAGIVVEAHRLAELASERDLVKKFESFYGLLQRPDGLQSGAPPRGKLHGDITASESSSNGGNQASLNNKRVLLLLCDSLVARSELIRQAMWCCQQQRRRMMDSCASTHRVQQFLHESKVVFVLHLPPSVKSRERKFPLTLSRGWQYYYVDDVSSSPPSGAAEQLSMMDLSRCSVPALLQMQLVNLPALLQRRTVLAFVRAKMPPAAPSIHSATFVALASQTLANTDSQPTTRAASAADAAQRPPAGGHAANLAVKNGRHNEHSNVHHGQLAQPQGTAALDPLRPEAGLERVKMWLELLEWPEFSAWITRLLVSLVESISASDVGGGLESGRRGMPEIIRAAACRGGALKQALAAVLEQRFVWALTFLLPVIDTDQQLTTVHQWWRLLLEQAAIHRSSSVESSGQSFGASLTSVPLSSTSADRYQRAMSAWLTVAKSSCALDVEQLCSRFAGLCLAKHSKRSGMATADASPTTTATPLAALAAQQLAPVFHGLHGVSQAFFPFAATLSKIMARAVEGVSALRDDLSAKPSAKPTIELSAGEHLVSAQNLAEAAVIATVGAETYAAMQYLAEYVVYEQQSGLHIGYLADWLNMNVPPIGPHINFAQQLEVTARVLRLDGSQATLAAPAKVHVTYTHHQQRLLLYFRICSLLQGQLLPLDMLLGLWHALEQELGNRGKAMDSASLDRAIFSLLRRRLMKLVALLLPEGPTFAPQARSGPDAQGAADAWMTQGASNAQPLALWLQVTEAVREATPLACALLELTGSQAANGHAQAQSLRIVSLLLDEICRRGQLVATHPKALLHFMATGVRIRDPQDLRRTLGVVLDVSPGLDLSRILVSVLSAVGQQDLRPATGSSTFEEDEAQRALWMDCLETLWRTGKLSPDGAETWSWPIRQAAIQTLLHLAGPSTIGGWRLTSAGAQDKEKIMAFVAAVVSQQQQLRARGLKLHNGGTEGLPQGSLHEVLSWRNSDGLCVDTVSQWQLALVEYGEQLIRATYNDTHLSSAAPFGDAWLQQGVQEDSSLANFVLKYILARGGPAVLLRMAALPPGTIPWLKLDRHALGIADMKGPSFIDPFVWLASDELAYARNYQLLNDAAIQNDLQEVEQLAVQLKRSTLPEVYGRNWQHFAAGLAGAFFHVTLQAPPESQAPLGQIRRLLATWDASQLAVPQKRLLSWVLETGRLRGLPEAHTDPLSQFSLFVGFHSTLARESWLSQIVLDFETCGDYYLPTMPENTFAMVYRTNEYLGWYQCPNGHIYAVGNCTMPMQQTTCPDCKEKIGGTNHNMLSSNRRLSPEALRGILMQPETGFMSNSCNPHDIEHLGRPVSQVVMLTLRLLLLAAVNAAINMIGGSRSPGKSTVLAKLPMASTIATQYSQHFEALMARLDISAVQAHTLMVACYRRALIDKSPPGLFLSPKLRDQYEKEYAALVSDLFRHPDAAAAVVSDIQDIGELTAQNRVLEAVTAQISEADFESKTSTTSRPSALIWTPRGVPTFESFSAALDAQTEAASKFPLLHALLRVEERLSIVQGLADVLAWHRWLFAALPEGSVSREEVGSLTHGSLLERLPADQQVQATAAFERFAAIFNKTLPMLRPNLYECTPNPFLNRHGQLDLSGTGVGQQQLSLDVSVAFGLPSRQRGETDARTICTIQIVDLLVTAHNDLLTALTAALQKTLTVQAESDQHRGTAKELTDVDDEDFLDPAASQRQDDVVDEAEHQAVSRSENDGGDGHDTADAPLVQRAVAWASKARSLSVRDLATGTSLDARPLLQGLPALTHKSDLEALRSRLIVYDRDTVLMPLIATFAEQSYDYSTTGTSIHYDFESIELELRRKLLDGKELLNIKTIQYRFTDELRDSGDISAMRLRVPQVHLPTAVSKAILAELDVQQRVERLRTHVEVSVRFLAALGTAGPAAIPPETPLSEFVLRTLGVAPDDWSEASTSTINGLVQLRHLQALYHLLEEHAQGGAVANIHANYRVALPEDIEQSMRREAASYDIGTLLSCLADLLPRLATPELTVSEPLKEYLTYVTDVDLEGASWWPRLPDALELQHAAATFALLTELEGD